MKNFKRNFAGSALFILGFSTFCFAQKAPVCSQAVLEATKKEMKSNSLTISLAQMFEARSGISSEIYEVIDTERGNPNRHHGRYTPPTHRYFANAVYQSSASSNTGTNTCEVKTFSVLR